MLIYSYFYKKLHPVRRNTEIMQLNDRDRQKLGTIIHRFPDFVRGKTVTAATRGIAGGPLWDLYEFSVSRPSFYFHDLANKVTARTVLSNEEIMDINHILYAHKYNWFWTLFITTLPFKGNRRSQKGGWQ